jgi:nitroimidazol reductase NimA-like FMN-containing flavoprotein (pyridoxamine 5'-phosphate oxidase superfamily)
MTESESWKHLAAQQTLFVSFVQEDGYPHVSPVRFVIIDQRIYFRGKSYKVKMKLADGAKVCCAWDNGGLRFWDLRGAVIFGRSRVIDDPDLLSHVARLLKAKYAGRTAETGPDGSSRWMQARSLERPTVVEIQPERVSTWDNTKLLPQHGA